MDRQGRVCINCFGFEPDFGECRKDPTAVAKSTPKADWCLQGVWVKEASEAAKVGGIQWSTAGRIDEADFRPADSPLGREADTSMIAVAVKP